MVLIFSTTSSTINYVFDAVSDMTNIGKLLEKMRNNPRDWRIEQLETIAQRYGVNVRKSGGSHVVFDHPKWVELLCVPAHRPIKPIYVKKLVSLIDTLGDDQ